MKYNQNEILASLAVVLSIAVVAAMVLLAGALSSILSWLLLLCIFLLIYRNNGRALKVGVTGYVFTSVIAVIVMTDNLTNFQTVFGGGHDDSDFFYTILNNLEGRAFEFETALFERLNVFYGKILSLLKLHSSFTTTIFDLLPLNWFVMANTLVVVDQIIKRLLKKNTAVWVVLVPLLFNYNIIFNAVLFYRDVYVILFLSLTVRAVLDDKYRMAVLFSIATGLFRGGNGFIILAFTGISYMSVMLGRINLHKVYLGGASLMIVLFLFTGLASQGGLIFALTSKASQYNRYSSAFGEKSYTEVIAKRTAAKALKGDNLEKINALGSGGIKSFAYKAAYSLLFPITFYAPNRESNLHKYMADYNMMEEKIVEDGYFYFTFVQWIFVLAWVFTLPFLVIGFYKGLMSKEIQFNNISYLYLVTFIAISQISFSARHNMAFIILHPIIMSWGYAYREKYKNELFILGTLTALGIFAYNYLKFF